MKSQSKRGNRWGFLFLVLSLPIFAAAEQKNSVIRGDARFEVLSPNLVRMEYAPDRRFVDAPSVAVQNRNWTTPDFHIADSGGWVEISTARMTVRYRLGSGAFGPENIVISWSDENGDHHWKPGDKDDKNLGGVPGDIALRVVPGNEPGPLSRNGYFLLDDSHTAVWNKASDWVEPRGADKRAQDWYFFVYGRDFKGMLADMTKLLGPVPMVPRYVFGTWFGSRTAYSEDEWKRMIHRFREEHVPLDVITLDSDSTAKVIWAGRDWDREQMPDPFQFFEYAKTQGIKVSVNEHYSALTPANCSNFERIRTAMGLSAGTQKIAHDLANKKYAELYMDILNKPALQAGMAFWWQDGNANVNMDGLDASLWTRHVEYTGTERITGKRAFDFERLDVPYQKGNAMPAWGVHRYGGYFTGDLASHWPTLNLLIPFNVQAGNMLIPYVINDNPGFTPQVVGIELYDRALEFHALSPIFWWHGIWGLRAPWEYGEESLDIARRFLGLRYSLIPYFYTYSRLAHEDGEPLVRGTYLEYSDQEKAYEFRQQYLLGRDLLVAPIAEPGFGQPVLKEIYLPSGDGWFDWFTGKIYEGGQVLAYECPLGRMPIFVRAGTILPRAPEMDYSDQRPVDPMILDVFAGKPGTFRLYEDDGTSLDYRKNEFSWTEIAYLPSNGGQHTITIGPAEGHYQGQPQSRRYQIRIHGLLKPGAVSVDGRTLVEEEGFPGGEGWAWNQAEHATIIGLPTSLSVNKRITVKLDGAGSFASAHMLQKLVDFRARVRQIEITEKIKWGMLLQGEDIKKEPHVLRETEHVEQELNDLVDNPERLENKTADFQSWTSRILAAFADHPFESNRRIPEADEDALKSQHRIENAVFTREEISNMTAELVGCKVAAKAMDNPSASIVARLDYDAEILPSAQVSYEISFPEQKPPGWGEISRMMDDQHFIHFEIQAPFPLAPGLHVVRVKAILKWDGGQTELTRDVDWVSAGDTGS